MKEQKRITDPNIKFSVVEDEITETPTLGPIALKQMINQLDLEEIAAELEIKKHHGVGIEDIIFVLLLYSSYGVTSISELVKKAQKDTSLNNLIDDITKINNKVIHYFQNNIDISTYEQLLDRVLSSCQDKGRFKSIKSGILIVDDSPLVKTGKKMENIEVIFDHVEKRYVLGYVLVAISYADADKSYCVNFQFRLSTEEDKKKAKQKKLKKKNEIDLRKKGSLLSWVNIQINNEHEVGLVEVSGINLNFETLQGLDNLGLNWICMPNVRTPLFDVKSNKYNFEELKQEVVKTKPTFFTLEGFQTYMKQVYLEGYGKIKICIVTNFQGNELGTFLLKKQAKNIMVSNIQEYFTRQQPADNNKLNIALDLFERAKNQDIKADTACADSWFFVAWFVNALLLLEGIKRFISKIKSSTEVEYKGKLVKVQDLWEKLTLEYILDRSIKARAIIVRIKGVDNPIKIVFVQELDKDGQPKARYILVCTDIYFAKQKIVESYKLRWSIECFFRTAKQKFGLDKFHVRKFNEIIGHITFVFISYLILAYLKICNHKLISYSFGEIIDLYLNSIIKLQHTAEGLIVSLGPTFFEEFGFPYENS